MLGGAGDRDRTGIANLDGGTRSRLSVQRVCAGTRPRNTGCARGDDLAFQVVRLHRVQAETLTHNVRSQRVLDWLGFVEYGLNSNGTIYVANNGESAASGRNPAPQLVNRTSCGATPPSSEGSSPRTAATRESLWEVFACEPAAQRTGRHVSERDENAAAGCCSARMLAGTCTPRAIHRRWSRLPGRVHRTSVRWRLTCPSQRPALLGSLARGRGKRLECFLDGDPARHGHLSDDPRDLRTSLGGDRFDDAFSCRSDRDPRGATVRRVRHPTHESLAVQPLGHPGDR